VDTRIDRGSIVMDTVVDGEHILFIVDDEGFIAGPWGAIGGGTITDEGAEQQIIAAIRHELAKRERDK
jgi:hypothetical protein